MYQKEYFSNKLEKQHPSLLFRIEHDDEKLLNFLNTEGFIDLDTIGDIPFGKAVNKRKHKSLSKEDIRNTIPASLYVELQEYSRKLGYEI